MQDDLSLFLEGVKRVAVVGVGSHWCGDDAVGVEIVRRLRGQIKSSRVLIVDAGTAPENYTSQLRRFGPSHIILIDAADFGGRPGDIVIADPGAITGRSVSTHTIPLSALAGYLRAQIGAEVILIGVQPGKVDFGSKMSEAVSKSMDELLRILVEKLGQLV
ncbi:MAG: hydrogenase maturation peptidase HycI [Candidatus Hadarchaeum sp.]|uniref:hydrogenase maturation peptidase HycI n=1 Tax=Candidatus Hadarchaeum sp. TaxID=2883567 RepID=UPI003D150509